MTDVLTIDELAERYCGSRLSGWRTAKNDRSAANKLCNAQLDGRRIGAMRCDAMSALLFYAWREQLERSGQMSAFTINDYLNRLRQMFKWGAAPYIRLVPPVVKAEVEAVPNVDGWRSPAPKRPPVRSVSQADVEATYRLAPRLWATVIAVHWFTGMRRTEVCRMRIDEIVKLPDGLGGAWLFKPRDHKTAHQRRERVVPLGPKAREDLEPWLATLRPGAEWVFEGCYYGRASRPTGRPVRPDAYNRAVARVNDRFGLADWTPKQVRKAYATRVARAVDPKAAQLMLDHSDVRITDAHYIDPDTEAKIALANRFG